MYQIIDTYTQIVVGTRKTRVAASNRADKLDNEYGAYRYAVKLSGE